ncbi:MAG TPA: tRNA cytidylyltransferase [Anaeromyxobacter sp.]|nr:tRNA cytidylyltransferase [Anaeromyxobacter sp.]
MLQVLRTLAAAGHRSWLVGGAVRDLLLHRSRQADFDLATPARPEEVILLFPRVIPTGIAHGTVTVLARGEPIEVTTFRGEGAYLDGRRPESVTFLADLEADLARRDFTMNAMAFDPLGPEFRDPFGGRADMRRQRVRAVGDPQARFAEDGLRPMRAVRFAAQLGYTLDPGTRRAIPRALPVVGRVAPERTTDELSKLLLARGVAEGLRLLRDTGLLGVLLPPLLALPAAELAHAMAVAARSPPELSQRLAALLHRLDRGEAARALAALRLTRALTEATLTLAGLHPCRRPGGRDLPGPGAVALRRWVSRVEPQRAGPLLALAAAEARALPPARRDRARAQVRRLAGRVHAVLASAPPLSIRDLALDGNAVAAVVGEPPGPRVGEALRYLLDRVLEHPEENAPERLGAALREWSAHRSDRI